MFATKISYHQIIFEEFVQNKKRKLSKMVLEIQFFATRSRVHVPLG